MTLEEFELLVGEWVSHTPKGTVGHTVAAKVKVAPLAITLETPAGVVAVKAGDAVIKAADGSKHLAVLPASLARAMLQPVTPFSGPVTSNTRGKF